LADGKDFVQLLQNMKTAAEKRKDSTKGLVAKIGRASRLGVCLKVVLEAGATSCNLILQSMVNSIILLLK